MDIHRYLQKKARGQVQFIEEKGEWFIRFDRFDPDMGDAVEAEIQPVKLEKLKARREEILSSITGLDNEIARITAAKAGQEQSLSDIDSVIADLTAIQGG